MPHRRLIPLVMLSLCACAHSGMETTSTPPKEEQAMTIASGDTVTPKPKLDAEHALMRLLDLIRASHTIQDVTQETLTSVMGLNFVASGAGRYGAGERITRDWWYGVELDQTLKAGPRLDFSFNPDRAGAAPAMSEICAMDFDRFASALEAMGFSRERYHGEHGRVIHDKFERKGLAVTVYSQQEASEPAEKATHSCIKTVLVN